MYGEYVDIFVEGKRITIYVPCVPNTTKEILKEKAIDMYLYDLKMKLKKDNLL